MLHQSESVPAEDEQADPRFRALRQTMQDIVIAHAAICFRHLSPEAMAAVQADWAATVRGRGWTPFFVTDDILPGAPKAWDEDAADESGGSAPR